MRVIITVCKNDSPSTADVPETLRKKIREQNFPNMEEGQLGWQVCRSPVYGSSGLFCLVYCKNRTLMGGNELTFLNAIRKIIVEELRIEFIHVPTEY